MRDISLSFLLLLNQVLFLGTNRSTSRLTENKEPPDYAVLTHMHFSYLN